MKTEPEINLNTTQKELLDLIRRHAPVTRAELSRISGITAGAVTRQCRDLLFMGLIREGEKNTGQRGQPSLPLMLNENGACSIGVSFNPGILEVSIVNLSGKEIISLARPHNESSPFTDSLALISDTVHQAIKQKQLSNARIVGIGYSVAGFMKRDGKRRRTAAALRHWQDYDLAVEFSRSLPYPTWVENNANAAAIGEFYSGHWSKAEDLIYIDIGFGIGVGVIVNSRIVQGHHGNAGEVGGYFPSKKPRPSMSSLIQELQASGVNIHSISDLASLDHPVVDNWLARSARDLEGLIYAACHWLDPEYVVLGGSIPAPLLQKLINALDTQKLHSTHPDYPPPKIRASKAGTRISSLGAAMIPIYQTLAPERN